MKLGVLLSGGVDSSTALISLKRSYPDAQITAYYLKIWLEDELASLGQCPWEEDLAYAQGVCDIARVPLKVVSLQREYWNQVVSYTISELKAGRTPSPDILCNQRIKFGVFFERVGDSMDRVATGHYAVVKQGDDGFFRIHRSPDPVKDQTYFLSHLTQIQAAMAIFPIGKLMKETVRELAARWDIPSKSRKDSQGICFLGRIRYSDFVRHYLGESEGDIVEAKTGRILGKHSGTWFYTIGQRSGLGLSGGPWFVVERNREENVILVASMADAEKKARNKFTVVNPSWIALPPVGERVMLKLRHGSVMVGAKIILKKVDTQYKTDAQRYEVVMDECDRGVAPGQFSVFYQNDVCLGGAMIEC